MKFSLLCSGSKGNCFVLEDENLSLVVDCGSTKKYLKGCLEQLPLSEEGLDALLITHEHTDHTSQIKMFSDLDVYAPYKIANIPSMHVIKPDVPFQLQHVTITPIGLSHDAPITVGYIFETWQEKLVYITDTGYLKQSYYTRLKDADYIVLESNHDVSLLMDTNRPQYVKMRIAGDSGHLSNDVCASILDRIVTAKTKQIFLAHLSQEANDPVLALDTTVRMLQQRHQGQLNASLRITAAKQFEMIRGGQWYEKGTGGSVSWTVGMGFVADVSAE